MASMNLSQASEEHFARIHRAALVLSGNPWDADDLAQETFLIFAREAHRFEGRSSLYTWLYGILLNLERRRRRHTEVRQRKLRVLWGNEAAQERCSPSADGPAEAAEWQRSLWCFVARLPDGQRQSLVLRFSEYLSYEEIAVVMDCPLGTVKSRIFNGLAALRLQMQAAGRTAADVPNGGFDTEFSHHSEHGQPEHGSLNHGQALSGQFTNNAPANSRFSNGGSGVQHAV